MTALEELLATLIARVERLTDRLDAALPRPLAAPDWPRAVAWRYRKRGGACRLEPVPSVGAIALGDLKEIDAQKEKVARNTARPTTYCSPARAARASHRSSAPA